MITRLEELSMNAWPSLQTVFHDGWVVRFADGYTKRSNSVSPLYEGAEDVDEKIDACEILYSARRLDTIFKVTTASHPPGLDAILSARGYSRESEIAVQSLDIGETTIETEGREILFSSDVSDEWLSAFCQMSGLDGRKKRIAGQMLLNVVPPKCVASISNSAKETIACGLAVLQGQDVGLFDIVTREGYRRRGYGRKLTLGLLHWAKTSGATRAYLQVVLNNEPALSLYSSLGFVEAYRYWYRVKKLR
jgi:N-acetylglutamate synthase